jgi:DNA polymerase I
VCYNRSDVLSKNTKILGDCAPNQGGFMRPKLYLIDGHAVAHRQFNAMNPQTFSTSGGNPTNAIYGFARLLIDILTQERPHYLAVSFDRGLSGRELLYPAYKAHRVAMAPEVQASFDWQMERIYELVSVFNIPLLALDGYEADDIIGTVATQAQALDVDTHIITGDRDILQLLNEHVTVQLPDFKAGKDVTWDVAAFHAKWGFAPAALVDYKALVGDTSDNIPGVKGVGEKTATELLKQYPTLENIYQNLDKIKPAVSKKLTDDQANAQMSYTLAQIMRNIPITLVLEQCVAQDYDAARVFELFRQLEFRSLAKRLPQLPNFPSDMLIDATPSPDAVERSDRPTFARGAPTTPTTLRSPDVQTIIVNTETGLGDLVAALQTATALAFDVETTSLDQMATGLVGIALSMDGQTAYYIPVGHGATAAREGQTFSLFSALDERPQQLELTTVIEALRPALTDPNIPKYAHNSSFDVLVLAQHGIDVAPIGYDTMIAEWLYDTNSRFLGLKDLARQRLGLLMQTYEQVIVEGGTVKNKKSTTINELPIERVAPYAGADAAVTFRLVEHLRGLFTAEEDARLSFLLTELEFPLIGVLCKMQRHGVLIDVAELARLSATMAVEMSAIEEDIYRRCGERFNINSPKQLNDVLFNKLHVSPAGISKTQHGYSTAAGVLEALIETGADTTGVVQRVLEYREFSKLKSTYVDALPTMVYGDSGRVHTSFNQTGTSTGRLSSSNPNLQNIPIRTEFSRQIRAAFIAPPQYVLLSADYSQIELRILAHITQDKTLLDAFAQDQDIHAATAAAVYGVPIDTVTYEQRSFAKRVNFGLLYGMGAYRLTRDSDLTLAESREFIERYFDRLPGVKRYHEEIKHQIRQAPYMVRTLFGRRRKLLIFDPSIDGPRNANLQASAEREAINMPVQGAAADLIKRAMIDLQAALEARQSLARMLLQVHDELLLELPEAEQAEIVPLVVNTMENAAVSLGVPLTVSLRANAQVGRNWRDMTKIK